MDPFWGIGSSLDSHSGSVDPGHIAVPRAAGAPGTSPPRLRCSTPKALFLGESLALGAGIRVATTKATSSGCHLGSCESREGPGASDKNGGQWGRQNCNERRYGKGTGER